jgi:PKD repeat protein
MRARRTFAHRLSRVMGVLIVAAAGSSLFLLGPAEAGAVITEPIPADVGPAPPSTIPNLPAAGETAPPPAAIGDPITPEATCGDWYQQSDYGDRWPADSTWWEYRCTRSDFVYYTNCTVGACPAFCWDCYSEAWEWTDYFYWDGSHAVFYGESSSYSLISEGELWPPYTSSYWWDAPTARWYDLNRYRLIVSKDGTGSGTVTSSPAGISCGDSCQASFDVGTLVTLTATSDPSSTFSGWSGPCSGTGGCQVTMDQARSVTATFKSNSPPPNTAPTAAFTSSCSDLSCSFDASWSIDSDGTIASYSWAFGDGTSTSGETADHSYAQAGSYMVTLTVTDDDGSSATDSQLVTVEADAPPVVSPPPPTFISTPDDYSSDSTPTWAFSGEPGATFTCTLIKPFVGAWDGGGDGTQPEPDNVTVDTRACDSGGYTFDLSAYPDGTYVLWVTQTDADGNTSTAATDSFVLQRAVSQNAAPQARLAFSCAALSCSFDGTGSSDADGTLVGYSWDFGDGASDSGASAGHTYAAPGTYTVTLTVTDDDGSSAADSRLVTIEAPPPESPPSPVLPPPSEEGPSLGPPPGGQGGDAGVPHPGSVKCGGRSATILGSMAGERLSGTPHKDVIAGLGGNDEIRGLGGGDILCGGTGADRLLGGSGPDKLLGGSGADTLLGGQGHDIETP